MIVRVQKHHVQMNYAYVPDLPNYMVQDTITEMKEQIDWQVLVNILTTGPDAWTQIDLDLDWYHACSVATWLQKNATGEFKHCYNTWLFQNGVDATAFVLQWK